MNRLTLIITAVVIGLLPIVYLVLNGTKFEESRSFRGHNIVAVAPQNGLVVVPTTSENKKGVPLRASFNRAYVESLAGFKLPGGENLALTVDAVSRKVTTCRDDATLPPQAAYDVAVTCAKPVFDKLTMDRKTNLTADAEEHLIIFGATGKNEVHLYHNNMIASYVSPDMTQTDRKREACIVRIMLDTLLGLPASAEISCAKKPLS